MRYWNLVIAAILVSIINQSTVPAWSSPINSDDRKLSDVANIGLDEEKIPRTIILDPYILVEIKQAVMRHDDSIMQEFLKKLLGEADSFLSKKPMSVIDKTQLPPSGDKHDFYSLAAYEWPNLNTPDGLPYVPRDGKINPEIYTIPDKKNMDRMVQMVKVLTLAYYFTNDPQYALKAVELLRVWFIDKDTYMNPNLKYAETVRGKNEMNSYGIMEGRPLTELTDVIRLLQQSPQWTEEMQRGMESWFTNYLDWLLNSDSGKKEGRKASNHGTYYLVQVSSIALFLNKTGLAKEILEATMQEPSSASTDDVPKLIAEKIKPDGRQPFELERANALDYHMVNLLALFRLASVGERVGVDLWNYEFKEAGIRKALDYILPYAINKQPWPYQQIAPVRKSTIAEISCQGMIHYQNNELYIEAYKSINTDKLGIDIYYPICNKMMK
jgi:Alginate lyase